MTTISIAEVETQSGIQKQPGETVTEYLRRVGDRIDLPAEDVEAIITYATRQQFGGETISPEETDAPVDEFLQAIAAINEGDDRAVEDADTSADAIERKDEGTSVGPPPTLPSRTSAVGEEEDDDGLAVNRTMVLLGIILVIGGSVIGGATLLESDISLAPDEPVAPAEDTPELEEEDADGAAESNASAQEGDENDEVETDEPTEDEAEMEVVDSAAAAEDTLEVTNRSAEGPDPADEFVELTNVGDVALDMSNWTVHDREDEGVVDAMGFDPITFPDGFVLESGESVRIVTAPGEDTDDTIHWGHDRQNWRQDGDVIIVLDGDGDEVLRHAYGDQAASLHFPFTAPS